MPDVTLQASTFERLQRHAKPFVDTPDTVINRALDSLERLSNFHPPKNGHDLPKEREDDERRIDPRILPNLTHTKVLAASVGGQSIPRAKWNLVRDEMLIRAMKRVGNIDKLRQICPANLVKGRKLDDGFDYLSEIDVSVQGQDANGVGRALVTAAQELGIPIDVQFMWRQKEGAEHPGEIGRLRAPT